MDEPQPKHTARIAVCLALATIGVITPNDHPNEDEIRCGLLVLGELLGRSIAVTETDWVPSDYHLRLELARRLQPIFGGHLPEEYIDPAPMEGWV